MGAREFQCLPQTLVQFSRSVTVDGQGAWILAFVGTPEIMVCFGFCFACKFLWINSFCCPVSVQFVNSRNLSLRGLQVILIPLATI